MKQLARERSEALIRGEPRKELRGLVAGWTVAATWSAVAWVAAAALPGAAALFTLVLPPLIAAAIGYLVRHRGAAMGVAAIFALALALVVGAAAGTSPASWAAAAAYLALGGPLAAWLASLGAGLRDRLDSPASGAADPSPPALLSLLVAVQRQLDERAEHRAVLSLDVAGAREMRRDASEVAAAQSFGQLGEWVEGVIRQCGGDYRAGTGDGGWPSSRRTPPP